MKREFIVLRETSQQKKCGANLRFALPEIALETLSNSEVAEIQNERDFIALAPNMPVCLQDSVPSQNGDLGGATTDCCTWGIDSVGAQYSGLNGKGMVAAILDTGIDSAHLAFSGMDLVERDFVGGGNGDRNGHGTHCAGTFFGRDVAGVRIGVANGVEKALIAKVVDDEGRGESWSVFQALEWAAVRGANAIVMSLSISLSNSITQLVEAGYSPDAAASLTLEGYHSLIALYRKYVAFLRLRSRATVVITGVGDASVGSMNVPWQLSAEPLSVVGGITSVGALDRGGDGLVVAGFSNSNPDLVAPGVDILSAKAGSQGLIAKSGTSIAAPYVAGVALLWGQYLAERRSFTSFDLEAYVTTSGDVLDIAPGIPKINLGKGLVESPGVVREKKLLPRPAATSKAMVFYKTKRMGLSELLKLQSGPKVESHRGVKTLRRLARARK